eukprot:9462680-Pyramimonas_sp.AAC.1
MAESCTDTRAPTSGSGARYARGPPCSARAAPPNHPLSLSLRERICVVAISVLMQGGPVERLDLHGPLGARARAAWRNSALSVEDGMRMGAQGAVGGHWNGSGSAGTGVHDLGGVVGIGPDLGR